LTEGQDQDSTAVRVADPESAGAAIAFAKAQ
jgi:hypothetical protein